MLSFRKTKISEIDFDNYTERDWDCGSKYANKRFRLFLYKPTNEFYLIRFLYNYFGSDEIVISNEPINESIILKPFEKIF